MKNILIVGAGISGATCAYILSNKGYNITIIDKNEYIGGNCFDYLSENNSCYIHKFGPHIFHTDKQYIWKFINQFDHFNTYHHCVYTLVDNNIYTFPINLNVISKLYNINVYSKQQVDNLIHDKFYENPQNFQQMAINSVGTKIYESFIKNYTIKQWNTDPKNLSAQIFKRINIRYNFNNDYFQNEFQGQPIHGYTNLINNMLNNKNINVLLNVSFEEINSSKYDLIIYTGSFKGLPYRSIKFEFYQDKPNDFSVLNLPNDKKITRITNFNLLHHIKNSDVNYFCKQFPSYNNQFNELYPIRNENNLSLYNKLISKMKNKYKNIVFCGRLALYQYLDMDDAIDEAIKLCKIIEIN